MINHYTYTNDDQRLHYQSMCSLQGNRGYSSECFIVLLIRYLFLCISFRQRNDRYNVRCSVLLRIIINVCCQYVISSVSIRSDVAYALISGSCVILNRYQRYVSLFSFCQRNNPYSVNNILPFLILIFVFFLLLSYSP